MKLLLTSVLWGILFMVSAQTPLVEKLMEEGIELYDLGKYDEAIARYEKALSLHPRNMAARYELAYTWYTKGNYDKAIEHSRIVVQADDDYWIDGVVIYGASLENKGLSKRAVKVFEQGIAKRPDHPQLRYNAALSYFSLKQYALAEQYLSVSIENDRANPSAHLLMANTALAQGDKNKCLMALYYFLLLEADSERSAQALVLLQSVAGHVMKSGQVEVALPDGDGGTTASEVDVHVKFTLGFLKYLEADKSKYSGFWRGKYVDFFSELYQKGYGAPLAYFTIQSRHKQEMIDWSAANYKSFGAFVDWMSQQ
ncbi:MAG: tetratricopeptide repeat protein [Breznakibacter sp.]